MKVIVNHLYQILHAEEDVRFLNTYKGVPISYPGQIVEIGKRTVRFNAHYRQLYCMEQDGFTYLEGNLLPRTVKAATLSIDMKNQKVLLGDFDYPKPDFKHRSNVRVEPSRPNAVVFWYEDHRYEATLYEISLRGITLLLEMGRNPIQHLHSGEMLSVRFGLNLPQRKKAIIQLEGRIRNIIPDDDQKVARVGLQIFPDEKNEQPLSRYIARRQKEILDEVQTLSEQARQRHQE